MRVTKSPPEYKSSVGSMLMDGTIDDPVAASVTVVVAAGGRR